MSDVSSTAPADVNQWIVFDVHKNSLVAGVLPASGGTPQVSRPVNSGPRPCLFDVGFPLLGLQVRTFTSDLNVMLGTPASPYGLGSTVAVSGRIRRNQLHRQTGRGGATSSVYAGATASGDTQPSFCLRSCGGRPGMRRWPDWSGRPAWGRGRFRPTRRLRPFGQIKPWSWTLLPASPQPHHPGRRGTNPAAKPGERSLPSHFTGAGQGRGQLGAASEGEARPRQREEGASEALGGGAAGGDVAVAMPAR